MPYEAFIERTFRADIMEKIQTADAICKEYMAQGFSLTLRQLYYQFVARGLIPNSLREYKNLGNAVNDGRLAGLIDWESIEDRTRGLERNPHWDDPHDALTAVAEAFAIDKWERQPRRVEVWIEKDALVGVIEPACEDLDVPYFSCRGYSSQSEQWRAAKRFERYRRAGQDVVVLHLGDHDPSGLDMTRDNEQRLFLLGADITVRRIALNMNQIEEHSPPPNPTKLTDSRATDYVARWGLESWELDALDPTMIDSLIRAEVERLRDEDVWQDTVSEEGEMRERLFDAAARERDWA